jgi:DNA-binding NarL/FixJ family response regulator
LRVALAEDSGLFRQGLVLLLKEQGIEVTAQTSTGERLLAAVNADPPDVAILDIRMPPTFTDEGLATATRIREKHPSIAVLVLSTYAETPYAMRLLQGGARGVGYLLKDHVADASTLVEALRRVSSGETVVDPDIVMALINQQRRTTQLDPLTDRERDVLRLLAEGRSNAGIGSVLHLSAKTVEAHVASVFTKLGLSAAPRDNRRVLAVLAWLRANTE